MFLQEKLQTTLLVVWVSQYLKTTIISNPVSGIDLNKGKYDGKLRKINKIINDRKYKIIEEKLRKDKGVQWHIRLSHLSRTYLIKATQYIPELKDVRFESNIQNCEICFKAMAK